jgi:hypothetical protein
MNPAKFLGMGIGLVLLSGGVSGSYAYAGNSAHGGDVVYCAAQPPVILDFYQAKLPTVGGHFRHIVDMTGWSKLETLRWVDHRLQQFVYFYQTYRARAQLVGDTSAWIDTNLNDAGDSGEPYPLPHDCTKKRAATRQDDLLFGDGEVIRSLSPAQEALLIVHERLYAMLPPPNPFGGTPEPTSVPVRKLMTEILDLDVDTEGLARAIAAYPKSFGQYDDDPRPAGVKRYLLAEAAYQTAYCRQKMYRNDATLAYLDQLVIQLRAAVDSPVEQADKMRARYRTWLEDPGVSPYKGGMLEVVRLAREASEGELIWDPTDANAPTTYNDTWRTCLPAFGGLTAADLDWQD